MNRISFLSFNLYSILINLIKLHSRISDMCQHVTHFHTIIAYFGMESGGKCRHPIGWLGAVQHWQHRIVTLLEVLVFGVRQEAEVNGLRL